MVLRSLMTDVGRMDNLPIATKLLLWTYCFVSCWSANVFTGTDKTLGHHAMAVQMWCAAWAMSFAKFANSNEWLA